MFHKYISYIYIFEIFFPLLQTDILSLSVSLYVGTDI